LCWEGGHGRDSAGQTGHRLVAPVVALGPVVFLPGSFFRGRRNVRMPTDEGSTAVLSVLGRTLPVPGGRTRQSLQTRPLQNASTCTTARAIPQNPRDSVAWRDLQSRARIAPAVTYCLHCGHEGSRSRHETLHGHAGDSRERKRGRREEMGLD
jgi:hypothetical protein